MTTTHPTILLIEDEPAQRLAYERALSNIPDVTVAVSQDWIAAEVLSCALVVADWHLGDTDELASARACREFVTAGVPLIIWTGYPSSVPQDLQPFVIEKGTASALTAAASEKLGLV